MNHNKEGHPDDAIMPEELPDGFFVDALEALRSISLSFSEHTGRLPRLHEWSQAMLFTARSCGTDLFSDLPNTALIDIKAKALQQKKFTAQPGDVIAIPTQDHQWLFALYLTSNRFGTALGLFFEKCKDPRPPQQLKANVAIYTGGRLIKNGRWRIVGFKPELMSLFPDNLDILHQKNQLSRSTIGEFGSAESPDGKIRQLKKGEDAGFGFVGNQYTQSYLEEYLETLL